MNLEYKSLTFDLKAAEETDTGWVVEGYGSTFDVDSGGDQIHKGAFEKTIKARFEDPKAKNGKSKIKVLWQHDHNIIIGKFLEIREDDNGLYCKMELFNDPDFPEAKRAYKLAKWGEIDSFSIGYRIPPGGSYWEEENGKDIRHITELKLYEVSLVTFPMNEKAEVTDVKKEEEGKMLEQILKTLEELSQKLDALKKEEPATEVSHEPEVKAMMECPDCGAEMECKACKKPKKEETVLVEIPLADVVEVDMTEEFKTFLVNNVEFVKELLGLQVKSEEVEIVAEEAKEVEVEEIQPVEEENLENNEKSTDLVEEFFTKLLNTDITNLKFGR